MAKIITIARTFGSGGRTIGKMLSEDLDIKYYDKDLIKLASEVSGINERFFNLVDEKLKGSFIRRGGVYKGDVLEPGDPDYTSETNLFNLSAKVIRELAEKEPAIIVGRCGEYILKDRDDVLKVFIFSDMDTAIKNVCELYGTDEKESRRLIEKINKQRCDYYRHHTGMDWENAKNYNLCLNTSKMDYETCIKIIKSYLDIVGFEK
jgi:cytidylate kinase